MWSRGEHDGHTGVVIEYDSGKDAVWIMEAVGSSGSSDASFNRNNGGTDSAGQVRKSIYKRTGGALAGHVGWKGYFRPK